ncbi:MAG TPA: DUF427 domain-containing protein [Streptosporangiaceae bacterium]
MATGHEITIGPAAAHVEIRLDGQMIAESDRAVRLDETGSPARYYFLREDVRTDLLQATSHQTTCPFKGQASYWSVRLGDKVYDSVVWGYETQIPEAAGIAGLLCFYNDRVDLTVRDIDQASTS